MKRSLLLRSSAIALPLIFGSLAGCGGGGGGGGDQGTAAATPAPAPAPTAGTPTAGAAAPLVAKSIVSVAQADARFSTLVAALQFASDNGDLVDTLSRAGNYTVFAPTNTAFDALARELTGDQAAQGSALLVPTNKALLRAVLQYHVLDRKLAKADLPAGQPLDPVLAGADTFRVDPYRGKTLITDARFRTSEITVTDLAADNGVVHAIDTVILPPEATPSRTMLQILGGNARYTGLRAALTFASEDDLVKRLSTAGTGHTLFAPDDDALDALAKDLTGNAAATSADLLVPANRALLRDVLEYHVVTSTVKAADIKPGFAVAPYLALNSWFRIETDGGARVVDSRGREAKILRTDVLGTNGVVHAIDKVLLPSDKSILAQADARPELSTLAAVIRFASVQNDLVNLLSDPSDRTLLAPNNAAFDALARELSGNPAATAAVLLTDANRTLLRNTLFYHVRNKRSLAAEMTQEASIDSLLIGPFRAAVATTGGVTTITDERQRVAKIVTRDVGAANGVLEVIDKVLLPRP